MHEPDFQRPEFLVGSAHFLASAGICPASVGLPDFPSLNVNFPNSCLQISSAKLAASSLFLWPGISLASVPVGQDRRSRHTIGSGPWAQCIAERKRRDREKLDLGPPGYRQASYLGLLTISKSSKEVQWWKRKPEETAKNLQTPDWFTSCYRCGQSLWVTYWDFQVLGPGTHGSWWKEQFIKKKKESKTTP